MDVLVIAPQDATQAVAMVDKAKAQGVTDVPAILLEVTVVDKNNLMETVIKDDYAKYQDVYANVSRLSVLRDRSRHVNDGQICPRN